MSSSAAAAAAVPSGSLVILQELNSSSPHFKEGASLRVTGKLQEYNVETAVAVIADGGATLAVDTQHLRLNLRVGSLYQFIGELSIQPDNEVHKLKHTFVYLYHSKTCNYNPIIMRTRH
ncbi:hypothetical protein Hdeb2414_s0001g00009511 [Helianthus debilis subsp. tardiflorus]